MTEIELELFCEEHLPLVERWFEEPETNRRLGGPDWPRRALVLAARPPAGTARRLFLARELGEPVALVDLELEHGGPVSLAVVVDPRRRRCGVGRAVVARLLAHEAHDRDVRVGVEPDNEAARQLVERSGFERIGVDDDGFILYRRPA